jgi:hypothetical protein
MSNVELAKEIIGKADIELDFDKVLAFIDAGRKDETQEVDFENIYNNVIQYFEEA